MRVLVATVDGYLGWWCPGCECMHSVDAEWGFDGNYDGPTLDEDVCVVITRRQCDGDWSRESVCHSRIRYGHIQFRADCTHALAGATVPMISTQAH